MSWHRDREVNQAFIRLMDALVSWERNTGRGSKLFFIPDNSDEEIIFMMDGKPLSDFSYSLILSQLDVAKSTIKGYYEKMRMLDVWWNYFKANWITFLIFGIGLIIGEFLWGRWSI